MARMKALSLPPVAQAGAEARLPAAQAQMQETESRVVQMETSAWPPVAQAEAETEPRVAPRRMTTAHAARAPAPTDQREADLGQGATRAPEERQGRTRGWRQLNLQGETQESQWGKPVSQTHQENISH